MTTPQWLDIGPLDQIPLRGARTIPVAGGDEIAVFRTGDGQVFALVNRCPHKHGPLSQGIGHGLECLLRAPGVPSRSPPRSREPSIT